MTSVSNLLCGASTDGDRLRYKRKGRQSSWEARPIVVWNCTRRCNLHCVHCYADAGDKSYPGELSTGEARSFIRDLSDFGVPVILFSGGEPLFRNDIFELAAFAREAGIRPVISTNGTLITSQIARDIHEAGVGEVGISLDGIGANNDRFRGRKGAFDAALEGIRNCVALGQKVSVRFTITSYNYQGVPAIFELVERENVNRVCFYHLAYAGRGAALQAGAGIRGKDIGHRETRAVMDRIFERTVALHKRGLDKEILTVDNHADGVYLYLKVKREQSERASEVLGLLQSNGGNNSGIRIAAVDDVGNVHADQFWRHYSFGSVRERKFGDIWLDTSDPLMRGLKDRKKLLKGRCARCQYLDLCAGNLRVRAEAVHGDVWAEDPACYLTDEEIGVKD